MRPAARLRRLLPAGASAAAAWAVSAVAAAAVGVLMLAPGGPGAIRLVSRMTLVARTIGRQAPVAPATLLHAKTFDGNPAVGALFGYSNGQLQRNHFCSGAVVDSSTKDLVITAAHCVSNLQASSIAFVPDFDGKHKVTDPYGVWTVTKIVFDRAWQRSANPNHDVAFLVVTQAGNTSQIQDVTGGDELGIGWRPRVWVNVVAYPDGHPKPIICQNRTRVPHLPKPYAKLDKTQMEFDCGGYTNGTSGGPFLARYSYKRRQGIVIGVIGGYEEGGDVASVSYSVRFGRAVRSLYQTAVSEG